MKYYDFSGDGNTYSYNVIVLVKISFLKVMILF